MKYSIVYSSATGNTERLARALRDCLPPEDCLAFGPPDSGVPESPLLFVGFWTDKGTCDQAARDFLQRVHGRDLFLFGTAGFGGSPEYFEGILERVRGCWDGSGRLIGTFLCQGRMAASVGARYEAALRRDPGDARSRAMLETFRQASSHPDAGDCSALQKAARNAYGSL